MDLDEIKNKFKHKTQADIKDFDLALKALPFLVREVERLETELSEAAKRIEHLAAQCKKRPPLEKSGKKDKAEWSIHIDEAKNRLYVTLAGKFEYKSAKIATNNIISLVPNLRENFGVIKDISRIDANFDRRAFFHLRKVMYSLSQSGLSTIAFVVNPETENITKLFEETAKGEISRVYKANSIAEAEAAIENVNRFLKG